MNAPVIAPALPVGDPTVRLTTLPSGLRVVSCRMEQVATVALGVWISAGSRDERADEHGLAHLLEHMAFKGTARRSARQIAEEMEAVGGDINAATSCEYTCYTARVLAEHVPLAVDVLADILLNSTFAADELKREQGVILQEIAAVEDTPDDLVYDLFLDRVFAGQPLGRPILGTRDTVSGFTPDAIRAYLARCYTPGRLVLAAAGAVDHDALAALAGEAFASLKAEAGPARPEHEGGRYVGGDVRRVQRADQGHLVLGFAGKPYVDGRHMGLQVLATALGGGLSSRLFQEVREQRGLAYAIDAFHWPFHDTGVFGIGAGASPKDVPELIRVTLGCIAAMAGDATETELRRARAQMKVGLLGGLETPGGRVDQIARQVLIHGRAIPAAEIAARIDAVTVEDLRAEAAALLASPVTLALVGPKVPGLPRDLSTLMPAMLPPS